MFFLSSEDVDGSVVQTVPVFESRHRRHFLECSDHAVMHGFRLLVFLAGRFGIIHHFGGVFFHFQQVESAYESYAVLFQSDVFRHPIPKHPTIVGEHVDSSGANVS